MAKIANMRGRQMIRLFLLLTALCLFPLGGHAQSFSGLARVDPAYSKISDGWWGRVWVDLKLTQGVPYRIYTLTDPRRLVLDFQEIDWTGVQSDNLLHSEKVQAVRFGAFQPGWSRLVADLAEPLSVHLVGMSTDPDTGQAHLSVELRPVSEDEFAKTSGAPVDPMWDLPAPAVMLVRPPKQDGEPLIIAIDPGHGGVDPGAERDGDVEKELMLIFARELREVLLRAGGFEVVMTRDADTFVSLQQRIAIAHQAGADVFLSLHADALSEGQATGTTVYTLSEAASDAATAGLAERHNRSDILAGVDLSGSDDQVTGILLDLARQETQPRTEALAKALVDGISNAGGPMNRHALRQAGFSVLKAADIPSVLIELGFLSNARDLENLRDPDWRARIAGGIRDGLGSWSVLDEAVRGLVRQ
jgi:N-acetylmuramoyl-L-alanine amidase